jgi:Tol biopolymer transport system component
MTRPSILDRPLLVVAVAAFASLLATPGHAFTLTEPSVVKVSTGSAAPADAPSQTSNRPRYSVSDDGCWMVFTSSATNLVSGQNDLNATTDVFLYDACVSLKVVAIVSHAAGKPGQAATGRSDQPVITADGNFVAFRSTAADIVEGSGFTGQTNVFLWDRAKDSFLLASHADGSQTLAGDGDSQNAVVSRVAGIAPKVAFETLAKNIASGGGDKNAFSDVYVYDGANPTGTTIRASAPGLGVTDPDVDGGSFNPVIDSDGNCVAFESEATNLVSNAGSGGDTNGRRDVFLWLLEPGVTLVSHTSGAATKTANGESTEPSLSDDCYTAGVWTVAFKSAATDLMAVQNDTYGFADVFYARSGGDAALVSHVDGAPTDAGSGASDAPILSRDGNWIAYASLAKDLAPGQNDTGTPSSDVFLYNLAKNSTTLVSHAAGDPKTVASGESFAPEIANNGLYVAYESLAKDLDPNQSDGNGDRDVFLYNARWNNSILASRRFASIAIAGEKPSIGPAISGNGYTVAFMGQSSDLVADDPEVKGFDDTFILQAYFFLPFISVRSTGTTNVVEWVTPPVDYVGQQLYVLPGTTCPTTLSGAGTLLSAASQPANTTAQFIDPNAYAPGTSRCYSIFVDKDSGSIQPGDPPSKVILVTTPVDTTGAVKWASHLSEFATLAQVGIGAQNLIAVAQDGGVYGIARGNPSAGLWSTGYRPFRALGVIQGRPPVLSLPVNGSARTTFVGSQDGRVYAFDADRGAGPGAGGALWYTTPPLGDRVQSGVAGIFVGFGGIGNHLLVGTRNSSAASAFFALDPLTGQQRSGSPFSGGGSPVGIVNTTASVDYALGQVYFTSWEYTAGVDPSLWCLKLTAGGLGSACWSVAGIGNITAGPVERNGVVYVGNDNGEVFAYYATGGLKWGPAALCGGASPVKSFVLADRQGTAADLYYATGLALCAITDAGTSATSKWAIDVATIPGPSAPLLARIGSVAYVYVGSTDGHLYQIEADNSANVKKVLVRTGATVGAPAFDVRDDMIYVGTDAGAIYAVQAPLN